MDCCCDEGTPGPAVGHASFNFSGSCPRGAPRPDLSVWTLQDGSTTPVNAIQEIAFGGTITGGTFQLRNLPFSQVTANIAWSSDPATLATRIYDALVATSVFGPADIVVTVFSAAKYIVEFTGARAGLPHDTMTTLHSLTGTAPTITITSHQTGASGLDEVQQLVYPYPPNGGTFKLSYDGQTTASITWAMFSGSPNFAAIANNCDAALEALSNIPAGGVVVDSFLRIRFAGTLARTDVPLITVAENLLTTSGYAQRRPPIAGAAVTLYKDGVEESSGTTDAAGNVRLPVYHPGTGFTVGVVASGFYPGANAVGAYSPNAAGYLAWGYNGGVRVELENPLTVPIKFFEHCVGREDLPTSGDEISLVGRAGTHAEGFSDAGVTDAAGIYIVEVPNVSPYDSLGSIIDYVVVHGPDKYACPVPPDGPSSEDSSNLLLDPCGNLTPDEWPG
jgi:hypothetical protein